METANSKQLRYQIKCPRLPFAVYREVAAHLRQVEGVQTGLNPASSVGEPSPPPFDYKRSQVGSLWLQFPDNATPGIRQQVDRILAYYGDRYGKWEVFQSLITSHQSPVL
ncbi:hypothetical protein ACL6C3_15890 [Capilliphycus salinus ALCB114379]|uniref:hypothetical protein n=1 Tax=Capilliphycus salinus TaxID=2768948 RepID=UPI0039A74AF1